MSSVQILKKICQEEGISYGKTSYYLDNYLCPFDVNNMRLLDIGGADGTFALYLHLVRGGRVDVLDEYAGHGACASNYEKLLLRKKELCITGMKIIRTDVHDASLPSEYYDVIYLRNCLHHIFLPGESITNVKKLMHKIYTWVRAGGLLVIGEVDPMVFWRLLPPIRHRVGPKCTFKDKSYWTHWSHSAEQSGFIFKQIQWCVPYPLRSFKSILENRFTRFFLGGSHVLTFTKG